MVTIFMPNPVGFRFHICYTYIHIWTRKERKEKKKEWKRTLMRNSLKLILS